MSTPAIDRCLAELHDTHQQMSGLLRALQLARQHTTQDETKAWLAGPIADHQTRIAQVESVIAALNSLAGTDYPGLPMPAMPAEVQADVQALYVQVTSAAEQVRESMGLLQGHTTPMPTPVEAPPVSEPAPVTDETPPVDTSAEESSEAESTPRRGRR
jgi:hypothetical protein